MIVAADLTAFVVALRSEIAKLRHARVLVTALLVPAGFVALKAGVFALRGEQGLGVDRYSYVYFFSIGQFFWDRLLVPLLAVAVCAWLVWLEDESGHWKVLLSQPVPRGAVYLSKLTMAWASVFLLQSTWWLFHVVCGLGLRLNGQVAIWGAGAQALLVALALAPVICVQMFLSVLLRSPFASMGIGVVGNTASLVLAGTAINPWHPWGLAQLAGQPAADRWTIWLALGMAVVLVYAGVFHFARKDI
jgi:hypothetical protein